MASRRLQTYSTDEITVTFDPTRCIHAAECIRAQPEVFDPRRRRWIKPDLAPAADVAAAIHRCPTGALHYEMPAGAAEEADSTATVRVERNGPLYLRGAVRIEREDGTLITEGIRLALCRCGATSDPPFCDGSHRTKGFRASVPPPDSPDR